jgi:hypothetical protein
MPELNPYEILKASPTATPDELRDACHSDEIYIRPEVKDRDPLEAELMGMLYRESGRTTTWNGGH